MRPSGLRQIQLAQEDGRWERAYESASNATVPGDLQMALDANKKAKTFFETLDRRNRYAILFRIQNVKKQRPEPRKSPSSWRCFPTAKSFTHSACPLLVACAHRSAEIFSEHAQMIQRIELLERRVETLMDQQAKDQQARRRAEEQGFEVHEIEKKYPPQTTPNKNHSARPTRRRVQPS